MRILTLSVLVLFSFQSQAEIPKPEDRLTPKDMMILGAEGTVGVAGAAALVATGRNPTLR